MKQTRNQLAIALTVLLTCMTGTIAAVTCPEPCNAPCNSCCDDCCGRFYGHIEWLYWRPCAEGIYVAAEARVNSKVEEDLFEDDDEELSVLSFDQHVKAKHFGFDFDSGVSLGIGYQSNGCCCLDFALNWTYFSPEESKTVKDDCCAQQTETVIVPFGALYVGSLGTLSEIMTLAGFEQEGENLPETPFVLDIERVKGNWDLTLHLLDFEIGRQFCVADCFHLRPHFDLRFARIDQDLTIKTQAELKRFDPTPDPTNPEPAQASVKLSEHFENKFTGFGPRAGLDAEWDLGCGFGVYGNVAAALVYGEREASNRQKARRFNAQFSGLDDDDSQSLFESDAFKIFSSNNTYCARAITDLNLGLFWNTCFCDGGADVIFKLGWEHHYFFNQGVGDAAVAYILLTKEADSTLSTQGVTLSLGFGF